MKTNLIIFAIAITLLCSCATPHYLPEAENIPSNQYGANIKVYRFKAQAIIQGELIAVDSTKIIIRSDATNICREIPKSEIQRYLVRYAESYHYGWTIPSYALATFSHGFWLVITMPVNILVTSIITGNAENEFTYKTKHLPYEELNMFARFPQGVPPNIKLEDIK